MRMVRRFMGCTCPFRRVRNPSGTPQAPDCCSSKSSSSLIRFHSPMARRVSTATTATPMAADVPPTIGPDPAGGRAVALALEVDERPPDERPAEAGDDDRREGDAPSKGRRERRERALVGGGHPPIVERAGEQVRVGDEDGHGGERVPRRSRRRVPGGRVRSRSRTPAAAPRTGTTSRGSGRGCRSVRWTPRRSSAAYRAPHDGPQPPGLRRRHDDHRSRGRPRPVRGSRPQPPPRRLLRHGVRRAGDRRMGVAVRGPPRLGQRHRRGRRDRCRRRYSSGQPGRDPQRVGHGRRPPARRRGGPGARAVRHALRVRARPGAPRPRRAGGHPHDQCTDARRAAGRRRHSPRRVCGASR